MLKHILTCTLFIYSPLHADTIVLCSDDGGRFPVRTHELLLHPQPAQSILVELADTASSTNALGWHIQGVPSCILGPLVHAMRQLHQIRSGYANNPLMRKYDYIKDLVWPSDLDNVFALHVAFNLGMDELIIAALAQRVARQLSTRWMFLGDMKARLTSLPEPLQYQVLVQHIILYYHLPWRMSGREVELSVSDVYEYSPKSIIKPKGWFNDWSDEHITALQGVMLDLYGRCVTSTEGLEKIAPLYPSIELIHFRECKIKLPVTGLELFPALRAVNFRYCSLSSGDQSHIKEKYKNLSNVRIITQRDIDRAEKRRERERSRGPSGTGAM